MFLKTTGILSSCFTFSFRIIWNPIINLQAEKVIQPIFLLIGRSTAKLRTAFLFFITAGIQPHSLFWPSLKQEQQQNLLLRYRIFFNLLIICETIGRILDYFLSYFLFINVIPISLHSILCILMLIERKIGKKVIWINVMEFTSLFHNLPVFPVIVRFQQGIQVVWNLYMNKPAYTHTHSLLFEMLSTLGPTSDAGESEENTSMSVWAGRMLSCGQ